MNPRDLAAKCAPMIATIGSAYYFTPETLQVGKDNGLDGFRFYVLGRGGVLGDVEPEVVTSAFGYFNHDTVVKIWNSAKAIMAPRDAARLHLGCAADFGRRHLADLDLAAFCAAAQAVNDAVDPVGLALYAGIAGEPLPDDDAARAIHLCVCLREARGSAHLAAVITAGVEPRVAHYLRRPDFYEVFGWSEPPEMRSDDKALLERADEDTDEMMQRPFSVLDPSGTDALLSGLTEIAAALKPS